MGEPWIPLSLNNPLYANADEDAIVGFQTAIENGYITDLGGHARFPGLVDFAALADQGRVYLHDWNDNLIAATSKGRVYSIDARGNVTDKTAVQVSGGRRVIFAKTNTELQMAAGGPIVRLRAAQTEILSPNAPLSTHVQWTDGYTIASEINSGRFYHSAAGLPDSWNPLDTFAADGDPDPINALMVTPFREIMIGGRKSIEQFEATESGDVPFQRRWSIGEGVAAPYCMIFAANSTWTINKLYELVSNAGQSAVVQSDAIGQILSKVDNWDDAWIGGFPDAPLHVAGQRFILLQIPYATNAYGSKGVTLAYDYRGKRWYELYGFDADNGVPSRWPGWSHWRLWDRTFVGGEGKVFEVSDSTFNHSGNLARWLVRTAHMADSNEVQIKRFRLSIVRGKGTNTTEGGIAVRCQRDGKAWGNWVHRGLGRAGDRVPKIEFGSFGTGSSFRFEITTTDDVAVDLMKAEIQTEPVGH